MKLITAIIRPDKLDEVIESLIDSGAHGLTVTEVRGFGRQYGQLAAARGAAGAAGQRQVALLPKVRLDIMVAAGDAETIAAAIAKRANTGTTGDGKIWITPVGGAMRVRTGERDDDAV